MNQDNLQQPTETVGSIVANDYRTAAVFKKFGIDFCCGGGTSVDEICRRKGIETEKVYAELHNVASLSDRGAGQVYRFNEWSLPFLVDFIYNEHHLYVWEKLPLIQQFAEKVGKVHGERHPETIEIAALVAALKKELEGHLWKEEHILFPYVKQLWEAKVSNQKMQRPHFGSIGNPIQVMHDEHDFAGETMHKIHDLADGFQAPMDACTTYRVLFAMLEEFENDLHQHVHLENNILFPKALALEQSLMAG
jgi:regulator of cell morphogenesis and NO signaling